MDKKIPPIIIYGLPLLFAVFVKSLIWSPEITPFNADEAIVGLMARHINQGHLPAFFYGQYYMGSLDAVIVSLGFKVFGENVWVGPRVSIISMNHSILNFEEYVASKPVRIGRDSWLATNCVILAGVELGPHTIVAAGAVVSKSYPQGNVILGGVPAKPIRAIEPYIKSEEGLQSDL